AKMTNLKDDGQMLGRHRHRIRRVGDLRDETAVLAERHGEALSCTGRAAVEHIGENVLVRPDRIGLQDSSRIGGAHGAAARRSTAAIAALVAPTSGGATERMRSPQRRSSGTMRVSAPPPPHRDPLRPRLDPSAQTSSMSLSTAGLAGSAKPATEAVSRLAAVTYWVRAFAPADKKVPSNQA